ncbi:PhoB family transcriptional regulator [Paenibacillus swuensis]|uniref:PhoB family transcriptional regulator n=1 Tax=Paenibacillus swuensis TaxID=1178515 RepID=A0A172TL85_9BACL|nr:response regulator transcription factor [Paenibacillus swuensis]ANE47829.1 PhoB family transcriptional regulator [Paenibacillus swuensis]
MANILIIEDEDKIARILQLELEHEGYQVQVGQDGRIGLELAVNNDWDLIILDVMLPELNGIEVLRRFRQNNTATPVMMVTARDTIPEKVSGFEHGANDYVTKPFAIEELLARIRNLLRLVQQQGVTSHLIEVDDLSIDTRTRSVIRSGRNVELTPKEFDLLAYLAERSNQVISREEIISDVWGYDFVGDTNVIDVYIRYLRQKIDKGFPTKLIHTSRGIGYLIKGSTP